MDVLAAIDSDDVYDEVLTTAQVLFNDGDNHLHVRHYLRDNETGIDDHILERYIENWERNFDGTVDTDSVVLSDTQQARFGDEIAHRLSEESSAYDFIVVGTEQEGGLLRLLRGDTEVNSLILRSVLLSSYQRKTANPVLLL